VIEVTPAVQRQSASADPGIATAPRSVVEVPMADGEQTDCGEVSVSVSAALEVSEEEEEKDEDAESGNSDDDEDMDDINPDPAREVSKVRISADDGGGYTRRLEC
jgi:hypothetical protein